MNEFFARRRSGVLQKGHGWTAFQETGRLDPGKLHPEAWLQLQLLIVVVNSTIN